MTQPRALLTRAELEEEYRRLAGRVLLKEDADWLQWVASQLGVTLQWRHLRLDHYGEGWQPGRMGQHGEAE